MVEIEQSIQVSRMLALYAELKTWRKVGKKLEISGSMACRVSKGYEPKDTNIRRKCGFSTVEYIEQYRAPSGEFEKRKKVKTQ